MSAIMNWRIVADRDLTNAELNELYTSSNYIPCVTALQDLTECGGEAEFATDSMFAGRDMRDTMERFTKQHRDVLLRCFYQCETAICPDGFDAFRGTIEEFTGHVEYTYDADGRKVG